MASERMTAAEYLEWERQQPDRHEFHPPRLVLTRESFETVVAQILSPGPPTKELRDLMSDDD